MKLIIAKTVWIFLSLRAQRSNPPASKGIATPLRARNDNSRLGWVISTILAVGLISGPVMASTPAAFLDIGTSARTSGMGSGVTAAVDDSAAVYWNPAALAGLTRADVSVMYTRAFETDYYSAFWAGRLAGIQVGAGYLGSAIDGFKRTALGSNGRQEDTGDRFGYNGDALFLAAATEVINTLALGVTLKGIREKADSSTGQGVGLDAGILWTPVDILSLGSQFRNLIAPAMKWNDTGTTETLPLVIRNGVTLHLLDNTFTIAADSQHQSGRPVRFFGGVEYRFHPLLALRAGVDNGNLSLGTGLSLTHLQLDFSWTNPDNEGIDDVYRFSLGYAL